MYNSTPIGIILLLFFISPVRVLSPFPSRRLQRGYNEECEALTENFGRVDGLTNATHMATAFFVNFFYSFFFFVVSSFFPFRCLRLPKQIGRQIIRHTIRLLRNS